MGHAQLRLVVFSLAVISVVAISFALPSTAFAQDRTSAELAELARLAIDDPGQREAVARTTSIDGSPVDLSELLNGNEVEIQERLATLEGLLGADGATDNSGAGSTIDDILASGAYATDEGEVVSAPGSLDRVSDWLDGLFPVWADGVWGIVAIVGVIAALFSFVRNRQRRVINRKLAGREWGELADLDPAELERRADEAERTGRFSESVRLRFAAGLIRLERKGLLKRSVIPTAGAARRAVQTQVMDRVATTFEEVAYGNRQAEQADALAARTDWSTIVSSEPT